MRHPLQQRIKSTKTVKIMYNNNKNSISVFHLKSQKIASPAVDKNTQRQANFDCQRAWLTIPRVTNWMLPTIYNVCLTGSTDMPLVVPDPAIVQGLEWLWQQRQQDFGFLDQTARAITALQLANTSTWFDPDNLVSLLAVKQMDIEIILQISK